MKRAVLVWAGALALLLAPVSMVRAIDASLTPPTYAALLADPLAGDPLSRLIGDAREAVGDALFLRADTYFHGGVEKKFDHDEEGGDEHEGFIEEEEEEEHEEPRRGFDPIADVNERLRVHKHYHLQGDERKEVLPLLALAVDLDPHNPEAILATAYWLERFLKKPDEAIAVLKKGSLGNPDSWEIESRMSKIILKHNKDHAEAILHMKEALKRSEGQEVLRAYRVDMNYSLAEMLIATGRKGEALTHYRAALALYTTADNVPLKKVIADKISALEAPAAH